MKIIHQLSSELYFFDINCYLECSPQSATYCHLVSCISIMSVSLCYMYYLPGHDQLGDINSYLSALGRANVIELGQVLGLRYTTLRDLPHGGFLNEVMTLWLNKADNVLTKGKPSWKSLVRGLRNGLVRQNGIANEIAADHHMQGMFALLQYIRT